MNKILLSLGTNTYARFNLKRAMHLLKLSFLTIEFTSIAASKPYGTQYKRPFLNTLAYFKTNKNKEELVLELKKIEQKMGRLPDHKLAGKIIIDIDLIRWNDEITQPEDFKRSYVCDLLPEVIDE